MNKIPRPTGLSASDRSRRLLGTEFAAASIPSVAIYSDPETGWIYSADNQRVHSFKTAGSVYVVNELGGYNRQIEKARTAVRIMVTDLVSGKNGGVKASMEFLATREHKLSGQISVLRIDDKKYAPVIKNEQKHANPESKADFEQASKKVRAIDYKPYEIKQNKNDDLRLYPMGSSQETEEFWSNVNGQLLMFSSTAVNNAMDERVPCYRAVNDKNQVFWFFLEGLKRERGRTILDGRTSEKKSAPQVKLTLLEAPEGAHKAEHLSTTRFEVLGTTSIILDPKRGLLGNSGRMNKKFIVLDFKDSAGRYYELAGRNAIGDFLYKCGKERFILSELSGGVAKITLESKNKSDNFLPKTAGPEDITSWNPEGSTNNLHFGQTGNHIRIAKVSDGQTSYTVSTTPDAKRAPTPPRAAGGRGQPEASDEGRPSRAHWKARPWFRNQDR